MNPVLEIPFAGGIDEATRPELVNAASAFTVLENVRQDKRGGDTKRLGYASLGTTILDATTISSGRALVPYGKTLSAVDSSGVLRTYSPNAARWVEQNRAPEILPTRIPMPYPGGTPFCTDVAYANGYIVVAALSFVYSTTILYNFTLTVYDEAEGTVVRTDEFAADLESIIFRLVSAGTSVVLAYMHTAAVGATEFAMRAISLASAADVNTGWSAAVSSGLGDVAAAGIGQFDACAAGGSEFVTAYNATGANVGLARFSVSGTTITLADIETIAAGGVAVAVAYDGTSAVWCAYAVGATVTLKQYSTSTFGTVTGTATAIITAGATVTLLGIASLSSTQARVLASTSTTGTEHTYARTGSIVAGAVTALASTRTSFRLCIVSKPFVYASRVYVAMVPVAQAGEANPDKMYFICDQTDDTGTTRAACVVAPRQVAVYSDQFTGSVVAVATGKYVTPIVVQRSTLTASTGASLELAHLDFTDTRRWRSHEFAECAYMAGGAVTFYDGARVDEAGFLVRPDPPVATVTASAGDPNIAGLRYIAIYQKTDSRGNVHWSAPSDPSNSVSPTSDRVNVVCTTLQLTQHHDASDTRNAVSIVLYRSGANGALPYQRVSSSDNGSVQTIADVINDYTVSTMTLVDDEADTTANQNLYRQPSLIGTEQAHQCPPAFSTMVAYNGMLVGVADDGITLFYSAYRIPGEGVWWSDVFQTPIAEEGPITALAVLDGTLFVLKRSAIFAIAGTAPSGNGAEGGFGDYRRLACDVGCIDPRSVVVTSLGVFFQSERGIEVLTRAQSVEPVGEAVQGTLAAFPVITAATLDASASIVRFECVASEASGVASDTGVQLVYDLVLKTWVSVDKVYAEATASRSAQSAAMAYVDGAFRYARLDKAGAVHYQRATSDGSAHLDGSTWVTQRATTSWIHIAGLQGEQCIEGIIALCERHTDHDFLMEVALDYSDTFTESRTFTRADMATLVKQWLHREVIQSTSQAIRIRISDATPTGGTVGTGKGATWVALTLAGEPHRGVKRTTATQRGG